MTVKPNITAAYQSSHPTKAYIKEMDSEESHTTYFRIRLFKQREGNYSNIVTAKFWWQK